MSRLWLLALLVALLCPNIGQSDWVQNCPGNAGVMVDLSPPGVYFCHNPQSANDDPGLLRTNSCENIDIYWYDNIDGTGGGSAGTAAIYTCPFVSAAATDTEAERELACQPLNNGVGTVLSATTTEIQGAGVVQLWADVEGGTTDNQLVVRCSQPSEKK